MISLNLSVLKVHKEWEINEELEPRLFAQNFPLGITHLPTAGKTYGDLKT